MRAGGEGREDSRVRGNSGRVGKQSVRRGPGRVLRMPHGVGEASVDRMQGRDL